MFLCKALFLRTTGKLPNALIRKNKAIAAPSKAAKRLSVPFVRIGKGKTLNLKGFDFDDLLG